jgi:hypothetical protein
VDFLSAVQQVGKPASSKRLLAVQTVIAPRGNLGSWLQERRCCGPWGPSEPLPADRRPSTLSYGEQGPGGDIRKISLSEADGAGILYFSRLRVLRGGDAGKAKLGRLGGFGAGPGRVEADRVRLPAARPAALSHSAGFPSTEGKLNPIGVARFLGAL